ncbi:MAG: HYR domain-containing protein [Bacteroidetes bacterium]|nr:MAG: HYR domain-containing protein [Bacteroidota bacterium]
MSGTAEVRPLYSLTKIITMMKQFIFFVSFLLLPFLGHSTTNWVGINTDWFNPVNWDNGLPAPGNDAIIPPAPIGGMFPEITNTLVIQVYTIDNRGIISLDVNGGLFCIGTFINRSNGILNIGAGSSSFTVAGGGTLSNFGVIANSGTLSVSAGQFINQVGGALGNFSQFFVSGYWQNDGLTTNLGLISNMGLCLTKGTLDIIGGLVNNNGQFGNQFVGVINVSGGGEFRNNNFWQSVGSSVLNVKSGGVFNNFNDVFIQENSSIVISSGGVLNNSANLRNISIMTNNGLINNFFCATIFVDAGKSITNWSSINNQGFIWNYGTISPNQPNDISNGVTITPANANGLCNNVTRNLDGVGTPIVVNVADLVNPMMPFCAGYSFNVNGANSVVFDCSNFGVNMVNVTINGPLGFSITCTAEVTINDPHPAAPACQPFVANIPAGGVVTIAPTDVFAGGFDNCGIINPVSVTPNQFFCAQLGVHTVTLNVNDGHGNMSSCDAQVTVVDVTPPTVTCKNTQLILDANGMAALQPADVVANAADNCGIMSTTLSQYQFDCAGVGPNNVLVTVTDHSGLQAACNATVTVVDNMAPVIGCQPQLQGVAEPGMCGANLEPDPPIILAENCGISNIISDSPGFFPVGTTIVTWQVFDNSGNSATCTQEVVVWDNQPPTITCNSISTDIDEDCILMGYIVHHFEPFVDDNCAVVSVTNDAPPFFTVGNHVVTWTAFDAQGNYAQCEQWVKVHDPIPPTLTNCPDDIVVSTGSGSADVSWQAPTASDNCGSPNLTSNYEPGTNFELGTYEVVYTASDESGNEVTCSFTITVQDNVAPIISNGPESMYLLVEDCAEEAIFEWEEPTVTDDGDVSLWIEDGWQSGDVFPLGTTNVTYVAEDAAGNQATYTFEITVEATLQTTCPADINAAGAANIAWNELLPESMCEECPTAGELEGYRFLGWHNGHQYYLSEAWNSWADAQAAAEALGGHLAVITDAEENQFVASRLSENKAPWIGIQLADGTGFWVNDEDTNFQNWANGAPSEDPGKNAGYLQPNGLWGNDSGEAARVAVVEFPCFTIEPSGDTQNGAFAEPGEYFVTYDVTDQCGYTCQCSFAINIAAEGEIVEYCTPAGIGGPYIQSVKIGEQAFQSGNDGGYADFTDYTFLVKEQQCVIELTPAGNESGSPIFWRIWVDLNQDGDFYDAGELLVETSGTGALSAVHKFTLPLPTDGTRMRVACSTTGFIAPCGDFHDGEVEDYFIQLHEQDPGGEWDGGIITSNNDSGVEVYPNPAQQYLFVNTLDLEGKPANLRVVNALGQQVYAYQTTSMSARHQIDLSDFHQGVYTIFLESEGENRLHTTFMVMK